MRTKRIVASAVAFIALVALSACGQTQKTSSGSEQSKDGTPSVVTTSAIVADFASRIAGDAATVTTLIPNGFDAHTYEPKPSELALLGDADLIVIADATLNSAVTGLVNLSGDTGRVLDLNAEALSEADLILREDGNFASANPHTWTSPVLAVRWVAPLADRLVALAPEREEDIRANAAALTAELEQLDRDIVEAFRDVPAGERKLVVYHDAWMYFGREYDLEVVGAIQAANFAEPSAGELAKMVDQIRREGVKAFFGSEVFPSDVLYALEQESGARYIPDLADDRLPGNPGDADHNYISLMRNNLTLLLQGLNG